MAYAPDTHDGRVPIAALHDWIVTVSANGTAHFNGTLGVAGDMPLHLHGLPSEPHTDALGSGRFRVRGMRFHMPGWWKVTLTCRGREGNTDAIAFDLVLPQS